MFDRFMPVIVFGGLAIVAALTVGSCILWEGKRDRDAFECERSGGVMMQHYNAWHCVKFPLQYIKIGEREHEQADSTAR